MGSAIRPGQGRKRLVPRECALFDDLSFTHLGDRSSKTTQGAVEEHLSEEET